MCRQFGHCVIGGVRDFAQLGYWPSPTSPTFYKPWQSPLGFSIHTLVTMERLLEMASTIPLPTISPTITGSASTLQVANAFNLLAIGPPPVTSTIFPTSTSFPTHPVTHRVFEHATKFGHIVFSFTTDLIIDLVGCLCRVRYHNSYFRIDDNSYPKGNPV